jgi:hypothetical protein
MKKIELETPVEEMNEQDLRATLAEVMVAHEANVAEYAEIESERTTLTEQVETLTAQVEEASAYFAARAAEYVNLPAEKIAEKFEFSEIREMADEADAAAAATFSSTDGEADIEDTDAADADADAEAARKFSEKPERAEVGEPTNRVREMARSDLERLFYPDAQ